MKYGKQVNDLKLKKTMLILSLICTLVCLSGCDLWYQDLKGYLEHWTDSVQVNDVSVQASPEIQKNSSGIDTIATYGTVMATVNIINPENYSLDGGVGSAEETLRSVRIAGSVGSSVLPLANVTTVSPSTMEIQIAPLAQVLTEESLAVEHTNFTVTFIPTRTENGLEAMEPRSITLRYNTPPRSPIELVYDTNQGKITWLGSNKWDIVQGTGSDLDDLIFWAWPSGITEPTHPDYVERFEVYEDGELFDSAAAADFLMSKESALQSYIPQEIKVAGYDIYCSLGTSGKTITVCAVDSEGVRSQMATSGIAPHKVILEANGGSFPSSGWPSVETYKVAGSPIVGSDLEVPFRDGYFLSGWTSNGSDISFPLSIDQPMTLVAQWTPYPADGDTGGETGGNTGSGSGSSSGSTFIISYNANGADSGTVPASQTKLAGKMVSLAKNNGSLTKQDHSFSGWNTAADGTGTNYAEGASYTLDASITLYAQWTRWNQVQPVRFSVGAGNVNFNTQVTLSTATPNATIHYTVNGSGEQIGAEGQSVVITIASDATITAYGTCDGMIQSTETSITYKLNTYTVSYDGNGSDGGAVPGVQSFTSGSFATVTGAGTMIRTGYTFAGWNTAVNGTGTPYTEGARYSSDANLTLYAQWQPNTYTVTFDGNNHTSGSTTSQTFTYGVHQNLNANGFQRTDCTFAGWNTAADGTGTSYTDGASYTATANITLYAQWTRWNQVQPVRFSVGAGNVNFNTQVTLSTATPNATIHYTVNGSGEQIGAEGQSVVIPIASDATITAYGTCDGMIQSTETSITYKLNTYTVSYDGNGSDGGTVLGVQSFTSGSFATVTGAGTMIRTGYTFTGWNTAVNGTGTPYTEGARYSSDANLTLYAQWQPNTYTVTFDGNNHTSGSTTSQTFTYGVHQNLNANGFQRTDCTFAGWNTAANGTGTSYTDGASYTATANITLYAQWTRWNQVQPVRFSVGAGNVNFNTQVTLSTATPNATIHYTVNGSGEQIGAEGQSVVITIASDATITAYGTCDGMIQSTETSITYKLNTYTVSYDGNGSDGGTVPGVQSFTSGSFATVTGAGTMIRTGYTFTGWNTAVNGSGTPYTEGARYSSDANLTLYAQWQPNTYTVTFDGNNHTSGSTTSQTFTYGVHQNLNANGFQRTDCTFAGWNTAANGAGTSYTDGASYTATANITLYAQWQPNTYTVTFNGNNSTSGSTSSQNFTYGVPQNLNANGFQRTGYTFAGWNTAANGSGTSYANGASYTATGDITLYAQWEVDIAKLVDKITKLSGLETVVLEGEYTQAELSSIADAIKNNSNAQISLDCSNITVENNIFPNLFGDVQNLVSITFPDTITEIAGYGFKGSGVTGTVVIPASVTTIGPSAFMCSNVTDVEFASGSQLKTIGQNAFNECPSLSSIDIPATVTDIGGFAFYRCPSLISVTIRNTGTMTLGKQIFRESRALTTVYYYPTNIGQEMFYECTGLQDFQVYSQTPPTIGSSAFSSSTKSSVTVTVPAGSSSAFSSASGWSGFSNIVER